MALSSVVAAADADAAAAAAAAAAAEQALLSDSVHGKRSFSSDVADLQAFWLKPDIGNSLALLCVAVHGLS